MLRPDMEIGERRVKGSASLVTGWVELVIRSNKIEGFHYGGSAYQATYPGSLASDSNSLGQSLLSLPKALRRQVAHLISSPRLLAHAGVITVVTALILVSSFNAVTSGSGGTNALVEDSGYGGVVDDTASAYIAADVAQQLELPMADEVSNQAQALNAQVASAAGGSQYLAKPAVVSNQKNASDIQVYTVVEGDTVESVANKFKITSATLEWANELSGSRLLPGTDLRILPVNGVLHTVAQGDTADSVAALYQANASQIVSYNDLEVNGFQPGAQIIIPDGIKPLSNRARVPDVSFVSQSGGLNLRYGHNGYDYGYCTWYAANRRSNSKPIPAFWGNAGAWKYNAQASGFGVGASPQVGAVAWQKGAGYLGHVAYVEGVSDDGGSVTVSEMNYNGWGVVSRRTVPASYFDYIY